MKNIFDCIVIGGGPAGMTAALYMCRGGYKTAIIMGKDCFGSLGKINLIENYPGIDQITGINLACKMNDQLGKFESELLTRFDFIDAIKFSKIDINNECKAGNYIKVILEDETKLIGKSCIFALGGEHNTLGLPNEEKFFGKNISFCATCDGPIYKNKDVAIIGGGNSAMDFALSLSKYCKNVDIIHRRNELRASKVMIDKVKNISNIKILLNSSIVNIDEDNQLFNGLTIKNNTTNEIITKKYDGCFYALGFKKKELPEVGTLITSSYVEQKNIFFAGDCIDEIYRQVITACGDGCKAALNCINYLMFN